MIVKTFIAGFGGQGVLSMGYTLAYAAMLDDKHVTYFPSYGAEVRGGAANCTVAVGDEEIASPVTSEPEYIVAMNKPSALKFENWAAPGGILFINSNLVDQAPTRADIEVVAVPANQLANEVANERSANMIMLGALAARAGLVGEKTLEAALDNIYQEKKKLRDLNLRAVRRGYDFIKTAGEKR